MRKDKALEDKCSLLSQLSEQGRSTPFPLPFHCKYLCKPSEGDPKILSLEAYLCTYLSLSGEVINRTISVTPIVLRLILASHYFLHLLSPVSFV